MFAWERDLSDWHDATTRASCSNAATKSRGAQNPSGNDPATNNADPSWDWTAETISDRLNASDPRVCRDNWIIKVDDHNAIIGDAICKESLDTAVCANAAMPIKVINGHVCKHANIDW